MSRSTLLLLLSVVGAFPLLTPIDRAGAATTDQASTQSVEPQASVAGVTVEVTPTQVTNKTFNRRNPPADMPQLKPGEAAVTESNFSCRTNTSVVVLRQTSDSSGSYSATVKVEKMTVTLGLEIVIWLPENGQRKLGAHEQGHQRISEHFYATAEKITTALAHAEIGREYSASAPSAEEAVDTAIREAGNAVCEQYMSRVQMRAANVQELYDKLTDHGRNRLDEDTAIERAIAADAREQRASASPSTAPARGS